MYLIWCSLAVDFHENLMSCPKKLLHPVASWLALSLRWKGGRLLGREKWQGAAVVHYPNDVYIYFHAIPLLNWGMLAFVSDSMTWWIQTRWGCPGCPLGWGKESLGVKNTGLGQEGGLGRPLGFHTRGALCAPKDILWRPTKGSASGTTLAAGASWDVNCIKACD